MPLFQRCVLLFFVPYALWGQTPEKFTISGYVSDAQSGERLIGATVFDKKSGQGTITNTYGFYSITLPADSVRLVATYVGYQASVQTLALNASLNLNISLESGTLLKEVSITAERYERIEERAQMSRIDVPIEQIKHVPALLGEVDVLKALQLLPGVSGGGEGQSGLYVRGGSPDQNLILLDGVPVYNASHLFGFFSVFNADAIKDVSLTKGGFPARYGGRLSSVIEINMKEGNENEYHGEGSVGIVASRLTFEGPIQKGKSSFIVSGRRTYIDLLAQPLIRAGLQSEGGDGKVGYFFYDLNAKVNHRFSDKDRLYLSFYTGKDKFYLDLRDKYEDPSGYASESSVNTGLGWGNVTTALRWNHVFSPRVFGNATLTYSRYNFNTLTGFSDRYRDTLNTPWQDNQFSLDYFSGIDDLAARLDFDFLPNPNHLVKFGANGISHTFHPGEFNAFIREYGTPDFKTKVGQPDVQATEMAAYIEDDWKLNSRLRINYGLHLSSFVLKDQPYFSLQPRLNARYLFDGGWAVKGAFSTMRQYIHLLTNETIGLPTDLWLPTTKKVKPQDSWQVATGIAKTFGEGYECSIEGYYKEMSNVIAFKEGASLFQFTDWQTRVTQGKGRAYGAEFFIQKKKGKLSGWIGYTLSWSDRQFDELNLGRGFPYKYDRRHDFEIVATYKFNNHIQVSGTWVYGTGNAVTFGTSKYNAPYPYYSVSPENFGWIATDTPDRNNFRYAPYHRLDLGVDFVKQKKRILRTWTIGAYNVYNRKNPFFLYLDTQTVQENGVPVEKSLLKQASLFPLIPSVSYSFKF